MGPDTFIRVTAASDKKAPFLPVRQRTNAAEQGALDTAADVALRDDSAPPELHAARLRLAERRMEQELVSLENASLRGVSTRDMQRLERQFTEAVAQ